MISSILDSTSRPYLSGFFPPSGGDYSREEPRKVGPKVRSGRWRGHEASNREWPALRPERVLEEGSPEATGKPRGQDY